MSSDLCMVRQSRGFIETAMPAGLDAKGTSCSGANLFSGQVALTGAFADTKPPFRGCRQFSLRDYSGSLRGCHMPSLDAKLPYAQPQRPPAKEKERKYKHKRGRQSNPGNSHRPHQNHIEHDVE